MRLPPHHGHPDLASRVWRRLVRVERAAACGAASVPSPAVSLRPGDARRCAAWAWSRSWWVVAALAGCAAVAPAPSPVVRPSADQRAGAPAALLAERKWLQTWFQGTPVAIGQREDGAVTVDVPREFCFDLGRTTVKPALAAVLDKVAESLRRVPAARMTLLAAPNDASGVAIPGPQRALELQRYLLSRGVSAVALAKPTATAAAAVQLRMEVAPP